jgi:NADH-quinone oxidoreductase subunit E
MAPYSIPYPLMPSLEQLEKMNQDLTRMMPKEMANNASKARKATETLIAEAQIFARDVTDIGANATEKALDSTGADVVPETASSGLMPEDFRQPKPMRKPAKPSDLKAISGIGPKLEKVLNGLGIWTYGQIAAWTSEEIAWVEDYLSLAGRVGRDDWTGQAAAFAATK